MSWCTSSSTTPAFAACQREGREGETRRGGRGEGIRVQEETRTILIAPRGGREQEGGNRGAPISGGLMLYNKCSDEKRREIARDPPPSTAKITGSFHVKSQAAPTRRSVAPAFFPFWPRTLLPLHPESTSSRRLSRWYGSGA